MLPQPDPTLITAAIEHLESKPQNQSAPVYPLNGFTIIRNSKVGACPREIWAYWLGMEPAGNGYNSQRIDQGEEAEVGAIDSDPASEGHFHEAIIKQQLIQAGWKLDGYEFEFSFQIGADCKVIGHTDMATAIDPATGIDYVGEVKTMGKDKFAEFLDEGWSAFPNYPVQLSIAMLALGKPGIVWIKNRDSGKILKPIRFDVPPVSRVEILRKVLNIRSCVLSGSMPPCGAWRKTTGVWCRFSQLHKDEAEVDAEAVVRPDLEEVLREYKSLGGTNPVVGSDGEGGEVKAKTLRQNLLDLLTEAMGNSRTLIAGGLQLKKSPDGKKFDEKTFQSECPELWKKYCTKTTKGALRVSEVKSG